MIDTIGSDIEGHSQTQGPRKIFYPEIPRGLLFYRAPIRDEFFIDLIRLWYFCIQGGPYITANLFCICLSEQNHVLRQKKYRFAVIYGNLSITVIIISFGCGSEDFCSYFFRGSGSDCNLMI